MEWGILPYKRYFDFSGRSRRLEYWMFTLLNVAVVIALVGIGAALGRADPVAGASDSDSGAGMAMIVLLGLYFVISVIPGLAVQVRRFHDQDKSGWLVLLGFIPYVGGIIVLIFMLQEGTRGENRYGPDPKGSQFDADTFA